MTLYLFPMHPVMSLSLPLKKKVPLTAFIQLEGEKTALLQPSSEMSTYDYGPLLMLLDLPGKVERCIKELSATQIY